MRVLIVGTSASGKTTLGRKLSKKLDIPYTDLDDLFWLDNWVERDRQDFLSRAQIITNQRSWIMTGNYSRIIKDIYSKLDLLIWLDYPLYIMLWRGLKRSLQRAIFKTPCCNNNQESFLRLFSSKSIIWWILTSHKRRTKTYQKLLETNPFHNMRIVRLKSQKETDEWLRSLSISL
ncbi:MAG: AAA family ATPase [Parachlamydiales bacterium]|nr:AAA family ATPase [Parachlamydiales bacterium]